MSFSTYEAEVVLHNFANRKRIHKEKVINIRRLYGMLVAKGIKLSKRLYDEVFLELERFGYGTVGYGRQGHLEEFLPFSSIKQVGTELLAKKVKEVVLEDKLVSKGLVTIYFHLNGKRCKALIPEDAIDAFEKMVYN